ncbi:hypothetical protein SARC_11600, partial [Sphaeroforma arctica JP610]
MKDTTPSDVPQLTTPDVNTDETDAGADALAEQTETLTIMGTADKFSIAGKGAIGGRIDWTEEQERQQADKNSVIYSECQSFEELNLSETLLKGVYAMGFKKPSNIQAKAFPIILKENKDLLAQSQSGTGKTAAFSLGMLAKIDLTQQHPQALCVSPARELAKQTFDVCSEIGRFTDIGLHLAVSGQKRDRNLVIKEQIVIGTPGSVIDLLKSKKINGDHIKMLVFDEADQMLDVSSMQADSIRIRKQLNPNHQTLMFSATFTPRVLEFASKVCPEAVQITIEVKKQALDAISQFVIECPNQYSKYNVVTDIYDSVQIGQLIIFVNKKQTAQELCDKLTQAGHSVCSLFGGNAQDKYSMEAATRDRELDDFKSGRKKVLVTTNVLSRGIDIDQVNMVINYDLPIRFSEQGKPLGVDTEVYLHRIG